MYRELMESRERLNSVLFNGNSEKEAVVSYMTWPSHDGAGRLSVETNCSDGSRDISQAITLIKTEPQSCEDLCKISILHFPW